MAFIREFKQSAGDPFKFRLPKWGPGIRRAIKKFQPGKFLAKNLGTVVSFVPVLGPHLGKLFDRAMKLAENIPGGQEQLTSFARGYGFEVGDAWDMGDPGISSTRAPKAARRPRPVRGHEQASASPIQKAKNRRARTPALDFDTRPAMAGMPGGGNIATILSGLKGAFDAAGGVKGVAGIVAGGGRGPRSARGMGGGGRRRINPANVHALRRSLRRVDSFAKLAKKVMPHLFRHARGAPAAGRGRGHKAGCGCAVCRRAA
jgi:hypothetical protein